MATQLQIRRGTTEQCDAFTGAEGEIIFDTTKKSLRLHDGITAGGRAIPTFTGEIPSGGDYVVESQLPTSENNYTWYRLYNSGWVEQGGQFVKTGGQNALNEQTLPVPMANTAYYANVVFSGGAGDSSVAFGITRTTTTLKIYPFWSTTGQYCPWEVKGVAGA